MNEFMKDIYILGAEQISVQKPLCEDWMEAPVFPAEAEAYAATVEPDYKQYFPPNVARRLGKLLKRAMLTSQKVMESTGIPCPGAILTGTGFGCVENTEVFLEAMTFEGEECLKPTCFMQSTHNTIGSLIAIGIPCHGYNSTYTNKGTSFECALTDACIQLKDGRIRTALVGAYDEMTPHYFVLLGRTGYLGAGSGSFCGEAAVSMMLGTGAGKNPLCRVRSIEMHYGSALEDLQSTLRRLLENGQSSLDEVEAVMVGTNGNLRNDAVYQAVCPALFPGKDLLRYKHVFGEIYTASGLGVYAAATCIHRGRIPGFLFADGRKEAKEGVKHILFYNHCENKNHSFILLSSCGK
ncbi:3-oxoacyl-ACP synthase [Bacteroidia bacterium]|nr:3-oxoacyl-ACP synthase [Bacteroidia bacterium]